MNINSMNVFDFDEELCNFLIDWDQAEKKLGRIEVIDFNLPNLTSGKRSNDESRLDILARGDDLLGRMKSAGLESTFEFSKLLGHVQTLRCLSGQNIGLSDFIRDTMGFDVTPYSDEQIQSVITLIEQQCGLHGISAQDLLEDNIKEKRYGPDKREIERAFCTELERLKASFEEQFGVRLEFNLTMEFVDVDAYWAYWIDGTGQDYRLRFNRSDKAYGASEITQFCLHELIAHCGQAAGWCMALERGEISKFAGLLTVHSCEQVHLEGFAQGIPFLLDETRGGFIELRALTALRRQMAMHNAYLALDRGEKIEDVAKMVAKHRFIKNYDRLIMNLADQVQKPVMRTYMFSYPKGIEIVHTLSKSSEKIDEFVKASLNRPLRAFEIEGFI